MEKKKRRKEKLDEVINEHFFALFDYLTGINDK